MNAINFPGLGLEFHIDRVAFSLFGKDIYWYGVIIALGFLLGVTYCYYQAKHYGVPKDRVVDLILFAAPGGIIGARIYYVLFYLDLYKKADGSFNWGEAVAIWDGGLAIYGGVIASVLILLIFCKVTKIKFTAFGDLGVQGLFIGQAIGRWGNFVNQEAHGGVTTLPWRMGLTIDGTYVEVHPTFLYESIWNVIGLLIARFVLRNRRKFDGEIFLFYLAWYGLGRVWIEGLRTDSLYLFHTSIRVSQLLAGLCVLIAGGILIYLLIKLKPDAARLYVNQSTAEADATASADTDANMTDTKSEEKQEQEGGTPHGSADH